MLLYGLSGVLIGPTLPGMISTFNLTMGQAGLIGAIQNAGGLAGALITLFIADRVSHNRTAVVSFVLIGLALFAVGVSPTYTTVLVTIALTGIFIRIMDVMLNASTGDFSRPQPGQNPNSGKAMSTLHLFYSIGAFVGPIAARAIMGAGLSWSQVFQYIGLTYIVVVVARFRWLRTYSRIHPDPPAPATTPTPESTPQPTPPVDAPTSPTAPHARTAIVLMGGVLFFYAIHQVGINSWVPYFLETARGANPNIAGIGLSAYWIGIILGRYLTSRLVHRLGANPLLVVGCTISAAATLAAVLIPHPLAAQVFFALAGVTSGATIPLGYSVAYEFNPTRTGFITAFVSLLMLGGRFLGPWTIGITADTIGLIAAMTIPGWALLFAAALGGHVWFYHHRFRPYNHA